MDAKLTGRRPFILVMVTILQFIVLSTVAMFLYQGGTYAEPQNPGYAFFGNFFSDLGRFEAHNGQPNLLSAFLFWLSLSVAGFGLVLFFIYYPRYFEGGTVTKVVTGLGSLFGILSGLSFVGVAFTPADILLEPHGFFVQSAFLMLLVAALIYMPLIVRNAPCSNNYAVVFLVFSILLILYVLLIFGFFALPEGQERVIQITGQKIIAYVGLITVFIQSYAALQMQKVRDATQYTASEGQPHLV